MHRKIYHWKLRNSALALGERTIIMGILNVTPDSFSDGGQFVDPDAAYAHALELEEQGADIIDIGAESTRPGSSRISADEEWQRLVPVLKRLRGKLQVALSLDTYKSETAERAIDYGIEIINDPSGLTFDARLAKTAVGANAGLILNHMRGTPESWAKLPPLPDAAAAIARDLDATVNRARRAGVERNRIVIDPGLGFGKRGDQNAEILAHLSELARLDLPVLVGPSRKAFLRQNNGDETICATAAAVTAAILNGAHIVRVHDVRQIRAAVAVADEIARAAAAQRVQADRQPVHTRPQERDFDFRKRARGEDRPQPPRPPLAAGAKAEYEMRREHAAGAGASGQTEAESPQRAEFGNRPQGRPGENRPRGRAGENRPLDRPGERRPGTPRDRERPDFARPSGGRFGRFRGERDARSAGADKRGGPDRGRPGGGRPPKRPFRKRP